MTTHERLEKVERQLARVTFFNRCVTACIVLSCATWFISETFGPETAWAGSGAKVIRANSFLLEDEKGKVRAVMGLDKHGAALVLGDENGTARVSLLSLKQGRKPSRCWLSLHDENGREFWHAP
jgi:hypothetical protein